MKVEDFFDKMIAAMEAQTEIISKIAKMQDDLRRSVDDLRQNPAQKPRGLGTDLPKIMPEMIPDAAIALKVSGLVKQCEDRAKKALATIGVAGADKVYTYDDVVRAVSDLAAKKGRVFARLVVEKYAGMVDMGGTSEQYKTVVKAIERYML